MPPRLVPLLLVALLLLGQVGGWLHEMSHHAGVPGQTLALDAGAAGQGTDRDDVADRLCLVCLGFAAMTLALPGAVLALALLAPRFARPVAAVRLATAGRRFAHHARGPPAFS